VKIWRLASSEEFYEILKLSEQGKLTLVDQEDYWFSEEDLNNQALVKSRTLSILDRYGQFKKQSE
tara:strand:- start:1618 stop:1812 length:195 start_codon:yes stop_codon:yes gene_type:complete